ncbi:MAG: SxtJ family membrane protein [Bacteroidia bacterium]|nr:hypothetical protein [Bacteroidia bacterium]MCZ2276825.1 SxtJ family membrane protein [Bacteroidia bacterium]
MDKAKKTEAILVIVTGLILMWFIFKIKILLTIGLLIGILSLLSSFIQNQIVWLWMKLAELLGYINGKILLSVIFFLFLTPIALFFKLAGKDPMIKKRKSGQKSLYTERNHTYCAEDLEHIW